MSELQNLGFSVEDTILNIVGDPFILGIIILIMLVAFMVALRLNEFAGIVLSTAALFLVFEYIPQGLLLFAIAWGVIVFLGLMKLVRPR